MNTTAPLVNDIVNNALFHSNLHISQVRRRLKSFTPCAGRLAANDFVMKCIEVRAVWWPVIWKFIWVSYIIALSDWRQWMLHGMSGLTQLTEKDNDQQNLSKVIVFDIAVYKTKSLQMSEDTVILFISS